MKLVWNVYIDDFNSQEIQVHNVFDHYSFMQDLVEIKKKHEDSFLLFEKEVKSSLMYFYCSKCEWEVVITSWPPYINEKEFLRINLERTERIMRNGTFIRESVNLVTGIKVDVYSQIMMNWTNFINYLWENRKLIKMG